jgi:hypothetical protein
VRRAARNSISLMTTGQASASTQIGMMSARSRQSIEGAP